MDMRGCGCGRHWTMRRFIDQAVEEIRERVGDERVDIAILGDHFEFNVPEKMLSDVRKERVNGLRLQMIPPEAYLVLKAPYLQENELRELKQLGGRIGLSPRKIAEYLEVLPADLRRVAHRKLVGAGFRLPV